ncbi:PA2778 family cysteine peptidase [Thioalkalivibrio thiocyanoxidans]|uniref:PA2778 family cysteine peptidase n=1 Tax=Thioalkalivibrio thiocyanoxidans TaxID=152475 RepID=UPI0004760183|nr:PA2778 family cysteine peptidase [Thioalkalivibrio thiocyanoxidans]
MIPVYWRRAPGLAALVCGLFAVLWLSGCATAPQSAQLSSEAPEDLPARVELEDTPFFPQEDYQCGPAALATVLGARGIDASLEELIDEVYIPAREGSLQAEMRAAARARDLVAYRVEPQLEAILREVAQGNPVVVFQNLGVAMFPEWHFAVVMGYDLDEREVYLRSGPIERHVNSFSRFERTWARGDRWAFLVTEPDQLPATAEPLRWLRAVNELEQVGRPTPAATGYRAAMERWPEHPISYVGLANVAFAQGDLDTAEDALRQLIERDPQRHEGWNNLAHVLIARQCGEQAREAASCASELAGPGNYAPTLGAAAEAPDDGDQCRALPPCPSALEARAP